MVIRVALEKDVKGGRGMTNREWLESLSDEEFFNRTNQSYGNTVCPIKQKTNERKKGKSCWHIRCEDCIKSWLKEEHNADDENLYQ